MQEKNADQLAGRVKIKEVLRTVKEELYIVYKIKRKRSTGLVASKAETF
jgi:hypothetical protein